MKIFKTWVFKWWEVSTLKVCLVSLGILLGLYFFDYLVSALWLWWVLFITTAAYFIITLFKK